MDLKIWVQRTINAESVAPALWVHPTTGFDNDWGKESRWTVSHSCGCAFKEYPSRDEALGVALALEKLRDWRGLSMREILEWSDTHVAELRAALNGAPNLPGQAVQP